MTDPERPSFGAAEVIEIVSKLETDDDAFIIGGQASNFWAWFFQDKEPELKLKGRLRTLETFDQSVYCLREDNHLDP